MASLSTTQCSAARALVQRSLKSIRRACQVTLGVALILGATDIALTQVSSAQVESPQPGFSGDNEANETAAIAPPPDPSPAPAPFAPVVSGIVDLSSGATAIMSTGQLRPENVEASAALESSADWLQSVNLPLYVSPGGEHWGWIYQGWLIPKGQSALAIGRDAGFAMVQAYENLYTFPVLEVREDGWFRVQYTPGGSAWSHISLLALGEVPLVLENWEDRLQAQDSLYFLASEKAQPLRSQPELATNMLGLVAADSLIEPLSFEGDWMRVRVTRPTALCQPLTGATTTEGWMRWRGDTGESMVWYQPDGLCPQAG